MAEQHTYDDLIDHFGADAVAHTDRFRQVSNRYPHMVAIAYGGDLSAAAAATDEQVAFRVAQWEQAHGLKPRDWPAIGADERGA